jgi:hypothetical protein
VRSGAIVGIVAVVLGFAAASSFAATGTKGTGCVVPNVKGLSLAKAKTRLSSAHCRLGTIRRTYSPQPAGTVLSQGVKAGTRLARNAPVGVLVSKGPAPAPPPPPPPPPPPTTTTTTAPPQTPVTAGSYKGATQDGNFVYFSITSDRQITYWRTNDLTEQCNAGYYIPGAISLNPGIGFPIDDSGHFDFIANGTATLPDGSPDMIHFEIVGNASGTNVSGTVVLTEAFTYNGISLTCASPVTSWTATLQP